MPNGYKSVMTSGRGGITYTAGDGIDITNDVISTKQSIEGDIDEIIDIYPTTGNLVSIVNAFNKGDIYSTNERMIGQWIDGKPLYQKVFPTTATMGSSYTIMISDTTEYNIAGIVKCYGIRYYPVGTTTMQSIPMLAYIDVNASAKPVYCYMYGAAAQFNYIILQYTKTTDSAISIGNDTDYSTSEKIVGTWIDGKPLYQKTVNVGSVSAGTTKVVDFNGIDMVCAFSGVAHSQAYKQQIPIVFGHQNMTNYVVNVLYTENNNKINVYTGDDFSLDWCFITIQYTKSTI